MKKYEIILKKIHNCRIVVIYIIYGLYNIHKNAKQSKILYVTYRNNIDNF